MNDYIDWPGGADWGDYPPNVENVTHVDVITDDGFELRDMLAKHLDWREGGEVKSYRLTATEDSVLRQRRPVEYSCQACGAGDRKLWRPGSSSQVKLRCASCLIEAGHKIADVKPGNDQVYDSTIDPVCWLPAVPDLDGRWWGYTAVPAWWCAWWYALPTRP